MQAQTQKIEKLAKLFHQIAGIEWNTHILAILTRQLPIQLCQCHPIQRISIRLNGQQFFKHRNTLHVCLFVHCNNIKCCRKIDAHTKEWKQQTKREESVKHGKSPNKRPKIPITSNINRFRINRTFPFYRIAESGAAYYTSESRARNIREIEPVEWM